ncbi:MAG: hypothetical protein ACXWJZ_01470 [Burkholderiaceae bacterium]
MARAPRESSREETGRNTRVPLGVARSKLSVPQRAGYVRRWVNDAEGRLQNAELGGYQFATDQGKQIGDADIDNENRDLGARISRVVDKSTGQKAYLMEIKEEFYREDQALKAAKVAEKDRLIKNGKLDDGEERYVPDKGRGISIETR